MKSNRCKVKFDLGDFPQEELYLEQKHAQGHALQCWRSGNYLCFESVAGDVYTYRLDFRPKDIPQEQWLERLQELGWEHCCRLHTWECLRKRGTQDGAAEEEEGLLHSMLDRATRGRRRAEQEMLVGVAPMAVFYILGAVFKNTSYAGTLWTLAALFMIVAAAIVFPAFRVRGKCGALITKWYEQKAAAEAQPQPEPEDSIEP